jgi:hypothetical protein
LESHQIVFKAKCVLKHKLELGGFGCLQFSKRQNTGLGDNMPLEVIKSFSKSDEMHWKHKVELGCFKVTLE